MARKVVSYLLGLMLAGMVAAPWVYAQAGPGRFQDRFTQVKRSQMSQRLGVDQRIVDQLLQIDQRYQGPIHQANREAMSEFQRLQQIMNQPAPSEQEVQNILANIKQRKRQVEELKQRKSEEEMALLSPVQQARYILYLQSVMQEARNVKAGPAGPPSGGGFTPSGPREIPVGRTTPR
jgi:uncharacterized protein YicC (UPF0701 family)